MIDSKMYYDELLHFIDRCGGTVIDKETNEKLDIVTVRVEFTELRDFDMPSNVHVCYGHDYVRFDIDYSLPELR